MPEFGACPKCGWKLVLRRDNQGHPMFLACWRQPDGKCNYTEPVPESVRLAEMGGPQLPDMEG